MYISEDGIEDAYNYNYDPVSSSLILDSITAYNVDLISENELVLSKEYGVNKSVWYFSKEE